MSGPASGGQAPSKLSHCRSVLRGAFVWACRARDGPTRRSPARAESGAAAWVLPQPDGLKQALDRIGRAAPLPPMRPQAALPVGPPR